MNPVPELAILKAIFVRDAEIPKTALDTINAIDSIGIGIVTFARNIGQEVEIKLGKENTDRLYFPLSRLAVLATIFDFNNILIRNLFLTGLCHAGVQHRTLVLFQSVFQHEDSRPVKSAAGAYLSAHSFPFY